MSQKEHLSRTTSNIASRVLTRCSNAKIKFLNIFFFSKVPCETLHGGGDNMAKSVIHEHNNEQVFTLMKRLPRWR